MLITLAEQQEMLASVPWPQSRIKTRARIGGRGNRRARQVPGRTEYSPRPVAVICCADLRGGDDEFHGCIKGFESQQVYSADSRPATRQPGAGLAGLLVSSGGRREGGTLLSKWGDLRHPPRPGS